MITTKFVLQNTTLWTERYQTKNYQILLW